jgi:hypothetical protein
MQSLTRLAAKPLELWESFWFLSGPPHGLAVFRILFGLYWLSRWLIWGPHVALCFSGDGMYFPFVETPADGIHDLRDLMGWTTPPMSEPTAWLLYLVTLASLAMVTAGCFTRPALAVYLASFVYHYLLFMHMLNSSFDRLLFVITVVLLLSPCGKALSVDAWRARRRGSETPAEVPLWTQRLICVQVAIMYFGTGVFKITLPDWNGGDLIFTSMAGDWATPLGFWLLQRQLSWGWYDLASLFTKVFEVWAAVLLFSPRWQGLFFVLGFLFHLSIALTLSVWQFMIMPLAYVLFVEPRTTLDRLTRRMKV